MLSRIHVLRHLVIALPVALSLVLFFIPARSENPKAHRYWRIGLIVATLGYSALVWYQQRRADGRAKGEREEAVRQTTERVTKEIQAGNKDTRAKLGQLSSGIDQLKLLTQSRSTDSPDKVLAAAAAKIEQLDRIVKDQQIKLDNATSTRTLTPAQQNEIIQALAGVCSPSDGISVVWEPDSTETMEYAGYFIKPLDALKCLGYRAQFRSVPPAIKGLRLITEDWSNPGKTAAALRAGLDKAEVPYTLESRPPLRSPTVSIVVGVK
jgi:hypothetical protein